MRPTRLSIWVSRASKWMMKCRSSEAGAAWHLRRPQEVMVCLAVWLAGADGVQVVGGSCDVRGAQRCVDQGPQGWLGQVDHKHKHEPWPQLVWHDEVGLGRMATSTSMSHGHKHKHKHEPLPRRAWHECHGYGRGWCSMGAMAMAVECGLLSG